MKLEKLRTRSGDDCLSDLQLDALALGALDEGTAERAARHLPSCERCAERRRQLAQATQQSQALLVHSDAAHSNAVRSNAAGSPQPATRGARRVLRGSWLGGAVAAAAAAAALFLLLGPSTLLVGGDRVRSKGTSHVGFFLRHAGVVRRGNEHERVSPGDALRFVVTSTEPSYVTVLSRDGAGQVSVYHPNGPRAARVEPGAERPLDASVVLDDVLGEERLYALACSAPIEIAPLRDALGRSGVEPSWPSECSLERFVLVKEGAQP